MTTYRDMEILLSEADDYVAKMLAGFEEQLQGDRIDQTRGEEWQETTLQDQTTPSAPLQEPSE